MNIKDYLHLYLGCDVCREHKESRSKKFFEYAKLVGVSMSEIEKDKHVAILEVGLDHFHEWYVEETILILRPLSDMTEEEEKEMIASQDDVILEGYTQILLKTDSGETVRWMLSKGFDLFGLIDAGLAIDKTKTNHANK
jgi:hypothetical protein